jgi:hypothetical protein
MPGIELDRQLYSSQVLGGFKSDRRAAELRVRGSPVKQTWLSLTNPTTGNGAKSLLHN